MVESITDSVNSPTTAVAGPICTEFSRPPVRWMRSATALRYCSGVSTRGPPTTMTTLSTIVPRVAPPLGSAGRFHSRGGTFDNFTRGHGTLERRRECPAAATDNGDQQETPAEDDRRLAAVFDRQQTTRLVHREVGEGHRTGAQQGGDPGAETEHDGGAADKLD